MSQFPPPVNPDDLGRGPMIMGLTWTFTSLAIVAVVLRFYVRIKLASGPALDDWLMGIALVFDIVSQSFVTVGYHYGLGKHDASLRPDQMINVLKWMWLANTPGLLVSIVARISIAVLLVRLFGGVHEWLKWFLIVVTGICTILTLVILPCTYLQTTPVSGNWNPFLPAKRWDPKIYIDLAFLGQALWTFTDLTFVLFPVMIIWRLQMAVRQRIGLVLLMSVSLLTMVLSILKTINLKHIADQQTNPTATDVQYDATLAILWTCLEQAFVIMMGCVPPLRSITRLEVTKTISGSLSSILRARKSSKSSTMDSLKYDSKGGPYEDLEMSKERLGRASKKSGITYEEKHQGSQQDLVKKNGILSTTETSVSYSRSWDNV
ncbi:integral membrane protein [Lojkania enalia]|uniref:Integral membrane protein n=1 Tax=Lojkania enalia TaxID=147567 RepID=A0A9P4TR15_9PLEO|nr:integral membrane protein [Didymosphaeria enalia]